MLGGSLACIKKIKVSEVSTRVSVQGVTEGTIQWLLYGRLKKVSTATEGQSGIYQWFAMLGSAGSAKFVASMTTYPHEVRFFHLLSEETFTQDIDIKIRSSELDFDSQVLTESRSLANAKTGLQRRRC